LRGRKHHPDERYGSCDPVPKRRINAMSLRIKVYSDYV
jgi:hypothetical protein